MRSLHVVLTCTLNARLRAWVRSFPPLVAYCTLDQYAAWVPEALTAVASHLLTPELTELSTRAEMVQELVDNAHAGRHSKGWTLPEAHKALSDTTQVIPTPATHAIWTRLKAGECLRRSM